MKTEVQRIEFNYKNQNFGQLAKKFKDYFSIQIDAIEFSEVLNIKSKLNKQDLDKFRLAIQNSIIQESFLGWKKQRVFDWFLKIEYLPGVTDNVARTAVEVLKDILGGELSNEEQIFSSKEYFISSKNIKSSKILKEMVEQFLANKLIERVSVRSFSQWGEKGPFTPLPFISNSSKIKVEHFFLNEKSDDELKTLSRNRNLALSLEEMKSIKKYITLNKSKEREKLGLGGIITDAELECLAQTWSEHCKHKIFAADIEYTDENKKVVIINSLYKTFIQKSTQEISKKCDWLVSVFKDNAGVVKFNDKYHLVYKVETHNSPSALDPYGGAMTGIVGVNRDPMGTGMGADLLINVWGYCFASPKTDHSSIPKGLLHPSRIRDGVHQGVIDGGNQSGIPYGLGWEYFDKCYLGKPLVFCGTVGLLPKNINGQKGEEKTICEGDFIVMLGGRVGKDGIHGATFSSEELHSSSPVQAVQIGDPITQKKLYDFLKEARSHKFYRFITDNGAGGLSSSIGEMAQISNGCFMDLAKVPLKYSGLQPWEILISEAQERMSFAVIPEKLEEFLRLAKEREVEAAVLGKFRNTGKFHVVYGGKIICYLDIDFMHFLEPMKLKAKWELPKIKETYSSSENLERDLVLLLSSLNIKSYEEKARQYDHEVKALSVIKPFIGKLRNVYSDATVFMVEPCSKEGIVLAVGFAPSYSDIDTYHMMASIIDMAVRKSLSVGAKLTHIAGLDNFCWPDPVENPKNLGGQYKLGQLVRANQALYDYCKAFNVPCISGKDSMKNDSLIGGEKISIKPTVLFSTIAKIDDVRKATHFAHCSEGEEIFVLGETKDELGGSQFFLSKNFKSINIPKVEAKKAMRIYKTLSFIMGKKLVQAVGTPTLGGWAVLWAKMLIGSHCGLNIKLDSIPCEKNLPIDKIIFSETNSRFLITVKKIHKQKLESLLKNSQVIFSHIGSITNSQSLKMFNKDKCVAKISRSLLEGAFL